MAEEQPKHIIAQPVRPVSKNTQTSNREVWAMVCYYYPQYTFKEASKLPLRDIKTLLRIARRLKAKELYDLTQIVAAPHTKKGQGVKDLSKIFANEMEQ